MKRAKRILSASHIWGRTDIVLLMPDAFKVPGVFLLASSTFHLIFISISGSADEAQDVCLFFPNSDNDLIESKIERWWWFVGW